MPKHYCGLILLVLFGLAGCATSPEQPSLADTQATYRQHLASLENIKSFALQGRFGVQMEGRGYSASTNWQHETAGDNLEIFSPIGSKLATIVSEKNGVVLINSEGKSLQAGNVEQLTQQALGWTLPMQGLPDWVLGRPSANPLSAKAEASEWDAAGRLLRMKQDGWEIEYLQYAAVESFQLPTKLSLRNPRLYLKFVVEKWILPQSQLTEGGLTGASENKP